MTLSSADARRTRMRAYSRQRRAEHPEKVREATRKYRAANIEKIRESKKKYREENREKVLESYRQTRLRGTLRRFGLTLDELNQKKLDQGGLCAICHSQPATDLDHDHSTGKLRGILCSNCNLGIGSLKDSPAFLRNAIDYLEQHGKA